MGYVTATLIIFALITSFFLIPRTFPNPDSRFCIIGEEPVGDKTVRLPPVNPGGGPRGVPENEYKTYKLIRENVYVKQRSDFPPGDFINPGGKGDGEHTVDYGIVDGQRVLYPGFFGEMDFYRPIQTDYSTVDGRDAVTTSYKKDPYANDQLRFKLEGMLFFLHLNPDGTSVKKGDSFLADVYQDVDRLNRADKGFLTEEVFICPTYRKPIEAHVVVPGQDVSKDKDQLQLEYFKFGIVRTISNHCKPAVYLYPEKKSLVNVKVTPKGILGYTDPVYDPKSGWTVFAEPSGVLTIPSTLNAKPYPYLYYEAKINDQDFKKPETGWVVRTEKLPALYAKILPQLGLNKKEQTDFTNYWNKALPKSPYYFVGIIDKNQRDYLEPLDVTPAPQTSIRFSLFFEALNSPKEVKEPVLGNTPKRSGFTLVDWGGMIKLKPGTPFTCSQ